MANAGYVLLTLWGLIVIIFNKSFAEKLYKMESRDFPQIMVEGVRAKRIFFCVVGLVFIGLGIRNLMGIS